jgi:hypothetical protein
MIYRDASSLSGKGVTEAFIDVVREVSFDIFVLASYHSQHVLLTYAHKHCSIRSLYRFVSGALGCRSLIFRRQ